VVFLNVFLPFNELLLLVGHGSGGGYVGLALAYPLINLMGPLAASFVLIAIFLSSWLIMFNMTLNQAFSWITMFFNKEREEVEEGDDEEYEYEEDDEEVEEEDDDEEIEYEYEEDDEEQDDEEYEEDDDSEEEDSNITKQKRSLLLEKLRGRKGGNKAKKGIVLESPKVKYNKPMIDLPIKLFSSGYEEPTSCNIDYNINKIEKTLADFKINVTMGEVSVGPAVTQFTLKPADGVKLNKIKVLGDDLALALAAHPIRIEAPIPGKSLVGIEVPNKQSAIVRD
jgi:S-DNA-T family DNA segregation ATPase FtsK/SpoIIIE